MSLLRRGAHGGDRHADRRMGRVDHRQAARRLDVGLVGRHPGAAGHQHLRAPLLQAQGGVDQRAARRLGLTQSRDRNADCLEACDPLVETERPHVAHARVHVAGHVGQDADLLAVVQGRGDARLADAEDRFPRRLLGRTEPRIAEAGDDEGASSRCPRAGSGRTAAQPPGRSGAGSRFRAAPRRASCRRISGPSAKRRLARPGRSPRSPRDCCWD